MSVTIDLEGWGQTGALFSWSIPLFLMGALVTLSAGGSCVCNQKVEVKQSELRICLKVASEEELARVMACRVKVLKWSYDPNYRLATESCRQISNEDLTEPTVRPGSLGCLRSLYT